MQPKDCFGAAAGFPAKLQKIACSEGILGGRIRFRCYSLHFWSEIEEDQRVGPDLFHSRARMRERLTTGGNG